MRPALIALLLVCFVGPVRAEDRAARARDELERELREMVKLPSATVEVVFDGIDSTRYRLLEASFALDDRPIAVGAGNNVLFAGDVEPGKHTLSTTFVYEAPSPSHGSIKYKVPGKFIFTAQRGVLMRVRARIEVDDGAEPSKRLQLVGQAETDLRAKLEEAPPPAPERTHPESTDNRPEEKQVAAEVASQVREPTRREPSEVQVAAASPLQAVVRPAVLKRRVAGSTLPSVVESQSPVAPPATEAKAPAAPPVGDDGAANARRAASAVEQRAPTAPASPAAPPPPVSKEPEAASELLGAVRGFGAAIAGSALALIGLLVFAVARKRR